VFVGQHCAGHLHQRASPSLGNATPDGVAHLLLANLHAHHFFAAISFNLLIFIASSLLLGCHRLMIQLA
jgi:hypothetical protein